MPNRIALGALVGGFVLLCLACASAEPPATQLSSRADSGGDAPITASQQYEPFDLVGQTPTERPQLSRDAYAGEAVPWFSLPVPPIHPSLVEPGTDCTPEGQVMDDYLWEPVLPDLFRDHLSPILLAAEDLQSLLDGESPVGMRFEGAWGLDIDEGPRQSGIVQASGEVNVLRDGDPSQRTVQFSTLSLQMAAILAPQATGYIVWVGTEPGGGPPGSTRFVAVMPDGDLTLIEPVCGFGDELNERLDFLTDQTRTSAGMAGRSTQLEVISWMFNQPDMWETTDRLVSERYGYYTGN